VARKQLHIWRASDTIIIQLKRFRVVDGVRTRINNFVDVPEELDLGPYIAQGSPYRGENNRFRLYAVSNHIGER
jgi:ubiquitin C-terminal hydrolase